MSHEPEAPDDEEELSVREELVEAAAIVLESLASLGFAFASEGRERLRSLHDELEAVEDDALDDAQAETLLDAVREATARALREAARAAGPAPAGDDPQTAVAAASFERIVGGAVAADDVLRLVDRVEMPGPLLALIAHAREPETMEEAQAILAAALELWNHGPRSEFDGETPAQRAARDARSGAQPARGGRGRRPVGPARGPRGRGPGRGGRH